ncbi:hypothetical protein K7432_008505 [Basidiobolus ranarum]|uniref:D-isomer specific 2-hydroxyacid dehydrogenase catalytic domain-containing protein n=1 Tax=Basidiobolus ranarum TaxID=34480 RepID=A0ABR2VZD6_9FUNG
MNNNQKKYRVLVTRMFPEEAQRKLEQQEMLDITQWEAPKAREDLLKQVKDMDGIICMGTEKIDKEVLEAAGSHLKVEFHEHFFQRFAC